MPNHPNPGVLPDEEPNHVAVSVLYRIQCGACEAVFEVESDPGPERVACEFCGFESTVEGYF